MNLLTVAIPKLEQLGRRARKEENNRPIYKVRSVLLGFIQAVGFTGMRSAIVGGGNDEFYNHLVLPQAPLS